jgi:hypothetical protein
MNNKLKIGDWVYVKPEYFSQETLYTIVPYIWHNSITIVPYALIYGMVINENKTAIIINRHDADQMYGNRLWCIPRHLCAKLPVKETDRNQKLFLLRLEAE